MINSAGETRELDEGLALFDGAVRSTQRAWYSTALLARSLETSVADTLSILRTGDAGQISALLQRMAHESFSGAVPHLPGFDAEKAAQLAAILMGAIAHEAAQIIAPREPELAAQTLLDSARTWVSEGRGAHRDIARIAQLVEGGSAVRAALIAPMAPAAASLLCVARAHREHVSFVAGDAAIA